MLILTLMGYLGAALGFAFLTLAIASGLYYLSELLEENTVPAKKVLRYLIFAVMGLLASLWLVDGLPLWLVAVSEACHYLYLRNVNRFPTARLSGRGFVLVCGSVMLNHAVWFRHFSSLASYSRHVYPGHQPPSFGQISAFFGICVWLVPFALFVSLSASDHVLPSMSNGVGLSTQPPAMSPLNPNRRDRTNVPLIKAAVWRARERTAQQFGYRSARD